MFKNIVKLGVIVASVALLGLTVVALTADEIMDMVDAEADALAMVTELLATGTEKVTRQQVASKAIRAKNQAVAKFVFQPEFQKALSEAGFAMDGEDITMG